MNDLPIEPSWKRASRRRRPAPASRGRRRRRRPSAPCRRSRSRRSRGPGSSRSRPPHVRVPRASSPPCAERTTREARYTSRQPSARRRSTFRRSGADRVRDPGRDLAVAPGDHPRAARLLVDAVDAAAHAQLARRRAEDRRNPWRASTSRARSSRPRCASRRPRPAAPRARRRAPPRGGVRVRAGGRQRRHADAQAGGRDRRQDAARVEVVLDLRHVRHAPAPRLGVRRLAQPDVARAHGRQALAARRGRSIPRRREGRVAELGDGGGDLLPSRRRSTTRRSSPTSPGRPRARRGRRARAARRARRGRSARACARRRCRS